MKKSTTKKPSRKSRKPMNSALVYLATLAPTGRRSVKYQLQSAIRIMGSRRLVENYNWSTLCYADMIKVRSQLLNDNKSVNTVNLCLAALKGTAQCAFHLGVLNAEALMHIKSVKRVKCRTEPTGRSLNTKELKALFQSCERDRSMTGFRDCALLAVMVTTGLRRAEVASLDMADYDRVSNQLVVSKTKGNKDRICQLPAITSMLLDKWIQKRTEEEGAIFCRIRKNDRMDFREMTSQTIYGIVRKRAEESRLGKVTPHDLRRSFVTRLLESNVDINTVRQLVGHSDIKTTSRYDLRVHNAKKYLEILSNFR